jgi:hypothetical protein
MRPQGDAVCKENKRKECMVLVEKTRGERPLRKHGARCEVKVKISLKKYDGIERSEFFWHMT